MLQRKFYSVRGEIKKGKNNSDLQQKYPTIIAKVLE